MNAIKRYFIERSVRKATRRNKLIRQTLNYADSKTIGLLVDLRSPTGQVRSLYQKFTSEGKKVQILLVHEGEESPFNLPCSLLGERDFSLLGAIKTERANAFMQQKFDFLYCLTDGPSLLADYVLANAQVKCRVGSYAEGREPFFELMVGLPPSAPLDAQIDQMLHYTRAIVHNEVMAA